MGQHILIVQSEPVKGREDEYNEWYEKTHLDEVIQVRGFISAQRFKLDGEPLKGDVPPLRYICIYEMETEDAGATVKALAEAAPDMTMSEALDIESSVGFRYRAIGTRHVRG